MDFCCVSSRKRDVIDFFAEEGFLGDKKFNTLHGTARCTSRRPTARPRST